MLSEAHPRHELHAWHPVHGYGTTILHPRTWSTQDLRSTVVLRPPCPLLRLGVRDAAGRPIPNQEFALWFEWVHLETVSDPQHVNTNPGLAFWRQRVQTGADGVAVVRNAVAGRWRLGERDAHGQWQSIVFEVPPGEADTAELQLPWR